MNRKTKNTINIIIILLLCGSMIFTGYLSVKYSSTRTNDPMPNMNQNGGNPPEMPDGGNGEMGNPPEMPNGENSGMGNPPEMPDGENSGMGNPPEIPNNNDQNRDGERKVNANNKYVYTIVFGIESLILSLVILSLLISKFNKKNLKEIFKNNDKKLIYLLGVVILACTLTWSATTITTQLAESANDNIPGEQKDNITHFSPNEIKESTTKTSGEYSSNNADENALLVNDDVDVHLSNIKANKYGDSNGGDTTSFYGTNSAIIAKDGATLTLKNITVETNATGANGVFSYGGSATTNNSSSDGTTINISDSKITTTKDNSGGIMTTGGGIMNAINLTIETSGISSAAIRTDRGGGTVNVDG